MEGAEQQSKARALALVPAVPGHRNPELVCTDPLWKLRHQFGCSGADLGVFLRKKKSILMIFFNVREEKQKNPDA